MSHLSHPTFKPVKWCVKCNRMVSKWHEHIAAKHFARVAYPEGFEK